MSTNVPIANWAVGISVGRYSNGHQFFSQGRPKHMNENKIDLTVLIWLVYVTAGIIIQGES